MLNDRPRSGREVVGRLALLKRYGTDSLSFLALEQAVRWWRDPTAPEHVGADVGYVDTGGAWLAIGRPLAPRCAQVPVAVRFAAAARRVGRHPAFVAVDGLEPFTGFRRLLVGAQPIHVASAWHRTLTANAGLRSQLRRAARKGITARVVAADDLAAGRSLRSDIDCLRHRWLTSRRVPPLGFLVSVEPFHAPDEHVYIVAARRGRVLQFLSAVPVYARGGWLIEDVLRDPEAPNGTTEAMFDCLMRHVDGAWVTLGPTPLAGDVAWPLAAARRLLRPFYDFDGLRRFRERLRPARWEPVWLVWDHGPSGLRMLDLLDGFAEGSAIAFGARALTGRLRGWLGSRTAARPAGRIESTE